MLGIGDRGERLPRGGRPRVRLRSWGLAVLVLTAACTSATPAPAPAPRAEHEASAVEALPARVCRALDPDVLRRIYRGTDPRRSGEIQLIAPEDFQAAGLSHASPFDTTQHVPLLIYAPGVVTPGVFPAPVTLADIAPTTASILGFHGFDAPDGAPLEVALRPEAEREPPRLVVTVIWDSAGMDLLNRWKEGWPRLRAFAARSAWFTHAALDASPSNTPPSHATIGTGAFPRTHGIPDEYVWAGGRIERPLHLGPRVLRVPTLGDRYDRALGNEPLLGTVGSLSAHLLMMSRGSFAPGGDRDLAVTREPKEMATGGDDSAPRWRLSEEMAPYYTMPSYVNDPALAAAFRRGVVALDQADGAEDGLWRDHDIASLLGGWETPARSIWQTELVEAVIEREGFGGDEVPDLLYVNYKMLDSLGHSYSADGIELLDGLRAQDRELGRLVSFLDARVGPGAWAMILTADHGMARDPEVTGARQYEVSSLSRTIDEAFGEPGHPVVEQMRPTQLWLDTEALDRRGVTVGDVAVFLMSLTRDQVAKATDVALERPDDPAFLAAIPTAELERLPCLAAALG
ncbi:MAG: alkaline phosphatase family protein [Actinomycetota bacterium]